MKKVGLVKYVDYKIDSFIVAIILISAPVSATINFLFSLKENANAVSLIFVLSLYLLKFIFEKKIWIESDFRVLGVLLLTLFLFVITFVFKAEECNYSVIKYVFYVFIPYMCMQLNFKVDLVLKYSLYLSLGSVFVLEKFFQEQYADMNQAYMGNIYPVVTIVIVCMFQYKFFRDKSNAIIKICYIYCCFLFYKIVFNGNRGATFSLIVCIFVLCFLNKKENQNRNRTAKLVLFLIIFTILYIIYYNNQLTIIQFFIDFFNDKFSSVPSVFLKMKRYILLNDVSNGRDTITDICIKAIFESPVWGHGMRTFANYTGGVYPYPHNFILQFLFEGGILFAFFPIYYSVKSIVFLFSKKLEDNQLIMLAVLVCLCFPKLLYSTDVWDNSCIWMLIAQVIIISKKTKYNKESSISEKSNSVYPHLQ